MRGTPSARNLSVGALDDERSTEAIRRLKSQSARALAPGPPAPRRAVAPVLAAMRAKNWMTGLVLPILAAVVAGIAVVVVLDANSGTGGAAPPTLSAGFPPARVATADFAGTRVTVGALASSDATEVAAGSAGGIPALWTSADGGSTWARAAGATAGVLDRAGQSLISVTHGPAGWLAVGGKSSTTGGAATGAAQAGGGEAGGESAATGPPLVVGSADGKTWRAADGEAAFTGPGLVTSAAAAGPAGYVIVGRQVSGGRTIAAAWYASGLTGWQRAVGAQPGALDGSGARQLNAVTATTRGFTAVGSAGTSPAAWQSANGRAWSAAILPLPPGTARAELRNVAANGNTVAATGTATTAAGKRLPFAAVSADGGMSWSQTLLPVPKGGAGDSGDAVEVTALTSAGGGFTATGTYGPRGARHVVVWLLPSVAAPGTAWKAATPDGTGLAGPGSQAITALTGSATTLTGVGYTATAAGGEPTLWQSPVRS